MNTRYIIYLFVATAAIAMNLMITSCSTPIDPDVPTTQEEIPPLPLGPTLEFRDSINFLTEGNSTVRPGSTFSLIVDASRGDSLLETLEVTLNGEPLPTTDYTIDGEMQTGSFFVLEGEQRNLFSWVFEITAPMEETRVIYEFDLVAIDDRTDATSITIDTELNDFSPPTIELLTVDQPFGDVGDEVFFDLRVDALGSPIDSIAVFTGAFLTESDRLTFDGLPFNSNPMALEPEDRSFFEKSVGITIPPPAGLNRNTIILTDSLGAVHTLSLIHI